MFARLIPSLLPAASLSAAAIAGSVLDPSGTAVLDAKASLYNPDTKVRQETASRADGKFVFDHLTAGQYILRVDKSGFAPMLREFNVTKDASVDRGITLRDQNGPAAASIDASATSLAAEPGQLRVPGEQMQQMLVHKINPVYPVAAKQAHTQGKVILQAVIDAEGVPKDIQVISSPDENLSQSALEAVRQWRYDTTLLNGKPTDVITTILVNYTLLD
jgi:TonB family protein